MGYSRLRYSYRGLQQITVAGYGRLQQVTVGYSGVTVATNLTTNWLDDVAAHNNIIALHLLV